MKHLDQQARHTHRRQAINTGMWLAYLVLASTLAQEPAFATPSGPLEITASKISVNQDKGTMHYRGAVRVRQDDLLITGTGAVASNSPAGGGRVVVVGKPVRAELKSRDSGSITILADQLSYDSVTSTLVASGNVKIQTPTDLITGAEVRYEVQSEQLLLSGGGQQAGITALLTINSPGDQGAGHDQ